MGKTGENGACRFAGSINGKAKARQPSPSSPLWVGGLNVAALKVRSNRRPNRELRRQTARRRVLDCVLKPPPRDSQTLQIREIDTFCTVFPTPFPTQEMSIRISIRRALPRSFWIKLARIIGAIDFTQASHSSYIFILRPTVFRSCGCWA